MSIFPTALQDETFITRAEDASSGPHIRAELTDRQLVDAVIAGNTDTFEQIYDRYKRPVAITAARFFRRPEQIEEIIQISFAKAFTELANFRGQHEASLGSWLTRIAANACLDTIRSRRRKPEDLNCELSDGESATLLDLASNGEKTAEENLAIRDLSAKLLARLPDDDRALLQMLYVEDMTVAEIADVLGWSSSKVKIRAWRARNVLRRILGQYL
ncbi:MAG: RNA polymerase sigma factor [Pyrinomonadaceae bacterium]